MRYAAILILLALPIRAETISAVWLQLAVADDPLRGVQYRLSRELGDGHHHLILAVHAEASWSKQTGAVYSAAPCDLWVDADDDGVLREGEHRRLPSSTSWCPLVGEVSVLPHGQGYTLLILAARWERWNRSIEVEAHPVVVRLAVPQLAQGGPP